MNKKVKSFVKETLARLQGDEESVIAEKNYRKATSALKSEISSLEGGLVDAEDNVENMREELEKAKYPTELIGDRNTYTRIILSSKNSLTEAEENLEELQERIAFLKETLSSYE